MEMVNVCDACLGISDNGLVFDLPATITLNTQKISGHQGAPDVWKIVSASAMVPGTNSLTRSARASCVHVKPPRYTEPRAVMSQRKPGASSVRSTRSEPTLQHPAFHGQNSSVTSMTKEPCAWYERADNAALTSSRRTQRPSRRLKPSRRGSAIMRSNG